MCNGETRFSRTGSAAWAVAPPGAWRVRGGGVQTPPPAAQCLNNDPAKKTIFYPSFQWRKRDPSSPRRRRRLPKHRPPSDLGTNQNKTPSHPPKKEPKAPPVRDPRVFDVRTAPSVFLPRGRKSDFRHSPGPGSINPGLVPLISYSIQAHECLESPLWP